MYNSPVVTILHKNFITTLNKTTSVSLCLPQCVCGSEALPFISVHCARVGAAVVSSRPLENSRRESHIRNLEEPRRACTQKDGNCKKKRRISLVYLDPVQLLISVNSSPSKKTTHRQHFLCLIRPQW